MLKKVLLSLLFTATLQVPDLSASAFQRLPQSFRQSWLGQKVNELARRIDAAEITKEQAAKRLVQATGGLFTVGAAWFFIKKAREKGPAMWEVDPEEWEEERVPRDPKMMSSRELALLGMSVDPELEGPPPPEVKPWKHILVQPTDLPAELDEDEQNLLDAAEQNDVQKIREIGDREIFPMRPEVWKTALKRSLSEEARQAIWDNFSHIE